MNLRILPYIRNNKYFAFISKSIISFLLLAVGGGIYVLFRPKTLQMFYWIDSWGLTGFVNEMREKVNNVSLDNLMLYSLPDGLWIASYIIMVTAIIPKEHKNNLLFWSLLLPFIAILFELLQIVGTIPGVFDIYDIIFYLIPLLIYIIHLKYERII